MIKNILLIINNFDRNFYRVIKVYKGKLLPNTIEYTITDNTYKSWYDFQLDTEKFHPGLKSQNDR